MGLSCLRQMICTLSIHSFGCFLSFSWAETFKLFKHGWADQRGWGATSRCCVCLRTELKFASWMSRVDGAGLKVNSFLVCKSGPEKGLRSPLKRHCRCTHRTSVSAQLSLWCAEGGSGRVSQEAQILPGVFCREWKLSSTVSPTGVNHGLRSLSFLCPALPASNYSTLRPSLIFQNRITRGYLLNPSHSGRALETYPLLSLWSIRFFQYYFLLNKLFKHITACGTTVKFFLSCYCLVTSAQIWSPCQQHG